MSKSLWRSAIRIQHHVQHHVQHAGRRRAGTDAGMTTVEYAVGTLAAVAFALVLLAVVRSDTVRSALAGVISTALSSRG